MSWRDRLKEGSWRGVPFKVEESRAAFGRRNQVHEYPQRDTPYAEDLGRRADRWSIDCLVVGEDYDLERDALIAALRQKGPGTLVHPYLGTVTASLDDAEVTDSTANGGMAGFSLQFVEAGLNQTPAASPDTQGAAIAASGELQTVSAASLTDKLSVVGKPGFVAQAAQDLLTKAQGEITTALSAVQPGADALFAVQQTLQGLTTGGLALFSAPLTLASDVFACVAGIGNLAAFADDALDQLGPLIGFGSDLPAVPVTTGSRAVQAQNQAAIVQLVRTAAAAASVNVVADMDFTSYDDAAGVRDQLAGQLDDLATAAADAGDDGVADAVDQLRLALIADVTARGASLARLYGYTPQATEPALVIAQRLYGDATQADQLIARNLIQHPAFVPAGQVLEVLSDA